MVDRLNGYSEEQLEAMAKEAKREYNRIWRKNNPDKVKAYNRRAFARRFLKAHKPAAEAAPGDEKQNNEHP